MMADDSQPNRWLHLRHPLGFDDGRFAAFCAHCEVWKRYCEAVLGEWTRLPLMRGLAPEYLFFEPTLSEDRKTATLPVGGDRTLGSRTILEDSASKFLWEFFPVSFLQDLEEGITEDYGTGTTTNWRGVFSSVHPKAR